MQKIYKFIIFSALASACLFLPLAAQQQDPAVQQNENGEIAQTTENGQNDDHSSQTEEHAETAEHAPDHGTAHHGSEVKLFGKFFGPTGQFLLKLFNFLLFASLLVWLLKGMLASMFKARADDIEAKLAQSEKDRLEGEAQLKALEAKMVDLLDEISDVLLKSGADAEAERQKILEAARVEAEQLLAHAHAEIEHHRRITEIELRELVTKLVVEGAEKRIQQQIHGTSAAQVMDQAIQQIGGAS
jgi:F-type H+-transporting ATPase subunit b